MSGFGKKNKDKETCPLCGKSLMQGTYHGHVKTCSDQITAKEVGKTYKKIENLQDAAKKGHWADTTGIRKHGHENCKICDALDQLK